MVEIVAVSLLDPTEKAALSVGEVASLCLLSRSRFHVLVKSGVFPAPIQNPSNKRPFYTQELASRCVEIRRTGIGQNGQIILWNKKPKKSGVKPKTITPAAPQAHQEIVEAIKSLGLTVTADAVTGAIAKLFPGGIEKVEQAEAIRKLFLFLQGGKK
jgi:hypothetical protein